MIREIRRDGYGSVTKLKYGNTNTYFVDGLLIDTDYAGTLPAFFKESKKHGIKADDIKYVLATHYHPDHIGLIGELTELGIGLLLLEHQVGYVHYSDDIYRREPQLKYKPIDENKAAVISCKDSRDFLCGIGIRGSIIPTKSHSGDGIALILDSGDCFVGDLEPMEFIGAYENNAALKEDWEMILSFDISTIHYGHFNEKSLK